LPACLIDPAPEEDQKSVPRGFEIVVKTIHACGFAGGAAMPNAQDLIRRARMFQERAEQALDPISRQHYLEMAAHYRALAVEHQETKAAPEREFEHGNR
jgi:hypothetical protein